MRTQKNKSEYIHIRVDGDFKKEFLKYCDDKCITPSKIVRKLIKSLIDSE